MKCLHKHEGESAEINLQKEVKEGSFVKIGHGPLARVKTVRSDCFILAQQYANTFTNENIWIHLDKKWTQADIDAEAAAQAAAREEAEAVKEEEPPWQPVPEDSFPKLEQLARSNAVTLIAGAYRRYRRIIMWKGVADVSKKRVTSGQALLARLHRIEKTMAHLSIKLDEADMDASDAVPRVDR